MYLLSIIIPVYNAEDTIQRTLKSLNSMSLASKTLSEVIIVDDGSQDRSIDITESEKNDLLPINLVVIKQENQGSSGARNTALKHCSGEWIFFLDADDELAFDPVPYIKKSTGSSAIAFSVKFYKNLRYRGVLHPVQVNLDNYIDVLTSKNQLPISSLVIKKNMITSFFDIGFIYLEDWLFWMMNPLIFEHMKLFINETSAILHSHGKNKTSDHVMHGKYREKVATKILKDYNGILNKKQSNNLLIQSQIGLIQQGKKMDLSTLLRYPCNIQLYTKLIIYFLFWKNFSKFDIYGR
jgi:glycosyltransferase involved in cell wall biosynthesis